MSADTDWTSVSDAAHREWVDSQKPQTIQQDGPVGPRECPITGRAFYDNMEHPDLGWIAMYGGPLDVYSIPRLDATDNELQLHVERYDLDADGWVEGGEPLGYFYRDHQPDHEAEVARLRAEVEHLQAAFHCRTIDWNEACFAREGWALKAREACAEADALRADVETWKSLVRGIVDNRHKCFIPTDDPNSPTFNWDERADAAMGEGK